MIRKLILTAAIAVAGFAMATEYDNTPTAVFERIKPVGHVCLEGDPCAANSTSAIPGAATLVATASSGESVYNQYCSICHNAGVAGAPMKGDAATWETRQNDKGMDAIYSNAINGLGGMPAKGTCMSCSDDDIKATVDYLLGSS